VTFHDIKFDANNNRSLPQIVYIFRYLLWYTGILCKLRDVVLLSLFIEMRYNYFRSRVNFDQILFHRSYISIDDYDINTESRVEKRYGRVLIEIWK
jgi:hypothetical protein